MDSNLKLCNYNLLNSIFSSIILSYFYFFLIVRVRRLNPAKSHVMRGAEQFEQGLGRSMFIS